VIRGLNEPRRAAAWTAAAISVGVVLAAQFPHLQAWRANRLGYYPDKVYTGALNTGAEDTATYWSWMQQARAGRFFFEDLYTSEDHPRDYVNVFFWILGGITRLSRAGVPFVYAASRPLVGAVVLWLLWRAATVLFAKPWEQLAFYLMALLPGGFEGLFCFLERNRGLGHVSSPGWWIPEMNTFFSLVLFPHFLAGFAVMIAIFLLMLRAWREGARGGRLAIGAGLLLCALTFFHPYDTVTMLAVLWSAPVAFAIAERRLPRAEIAATAVATAVWLPSLVYNWLLFLGNPAMRAWDLQNLMDTPEPGRLAFAFGIAGALAIVALAGIRRMTRPQLAMAAWFVSSLVLIHLPLRFQRRMIGGIQFPIAALAVFTLATWVVPAVLRLLRGHRLVPANGLPVLGAVLLLGSVQWLTPFYLLDIEKAQERRVAFPCWIRRSESDALRWIRNHTPQDAVVLGSYEMGNYVPAFAIRRCVLGHYGLTIDAKTKREEVARFFSGDAADDAWRRDLVRRYSVDCVIWTEHERALGGFDPASVPWLREVFRTGDGEARALVYAVETGP